MIDTNIGIRLKTGGLVEVVYPDRIGIEYETPWLSDQNKEGCREWNIDPAEQKLRLVEGRFPGTSPRFIIGKWGTTYKETPVVASVFFRDVWSFEKLPTAQVALGESRMAEENRKKQAVSEQERFVTHREFKLLEERLEKLEHLHWSELKNAGKKQEVQKREAVPGGSTKR
jgi:hypothetical protein